MAEENFSRNDVLYILVSLHSFHLKRNERLPLLARENKAPPAYRKKKRVSSKFMRKKKRSSCLADDEVHELYSLSFVF